MLSVRDWKKTKAKTLLGETVTSALTAVVDRAAALHPKDKEPFQLRALTDYSGAVKNLQVEIVKTRAKCKKGLHDETAHNLDEMEKEAKVLYADAQTHLKDFNAFLQGFGKVREACLQALDAVTKSQLPQDVAKAKQVFDRASGYMQNATKTYLSAEIEAGMQQMASASLILDRIAKAQTERQPAAPGGRALPATPKDLAGELGEVRGSIAKLKTPGGFYNQKFSVQVARSVDLTK